MSYNIVQHAVTATNGGVNSSAGGVTSALSWGVNTTAGNLLVAAVVINGTFTTTCSTAGWTKAISEPSVIQVDIWYAVASGSDPAPVFTIGSATTAYLQTIAEVGGIITPSLDQTAVTNTSGSPMTPSSNIISSNEFIFFAGGANTGSSNAGIITPSTASGGATFGADIDTLNANGSGLDLLAIDDGWATSGSKGINPLPTITMSGGGGAGSSRVFAMATFVNAGDTNTSHVKFNNSGLRPHPFSPGLAR